MLSASIPFLLFTFICIFLFFSGIIYFHRRAGGSRSTTSPIIGMAKPPLEHGSPKEFSKINIFDFVRQKMAPMPPDEWPEEVEHMTVGWGEPEDNCTVELYLALSYAERAAIKRHGLNEEVLEDEPLFDDDDLERIQQAQEKELKRARDERTRKALEAVHQTQLAQAKRETWGKTIEYYMTYPYTKTLGTPYQATLYKKTLETKVLPKIRNLLKEHVPQ